MLRGTRIGYRKSSAVWWLIALAAVVLLLIARAAGAKPKRAESRAGADAKPAAAPVEKESEAPAQDRAKQESDDDPEDETRVHKTDAEWKKLLTRKQYRVARQGETELPFKGKYWKSKQQGTYRCVCCDAAVFSSEAKFESGTGWPSFWAPVKEKRLVSRQDYSDGSL
ncbi:MAG TPA: peptide-methionine (R)-S-oxide reductase, partial [Pirellulales bacterium]|nr:peptide-methionine (R)-S-oxide reductase [Pirellulales bacterium]